MIGDDANLRQLLPHMLDLFLDRQRLELFFKQEPGELPVWFIITESQ